ncbi:GNAT family N-acetyltransferase [Aliidiomarina haloalkalitolerans]|uniref:GNAT family N-acetyltransferase n=1 Tax=Aliidiomarina haloalkalitolerans TaxID=859059 RepID=A0A432VQC3_9GAMM|nr:N-acetyltransferase [Aliidiomarina haloalkalitolerans]RUO18361.1 GNAT family N-acetyltransferase [Aliidiomarina haloalkalitolerans]
MFISPAQTSDIPKLAQLEYHDYQEEGYPNTFFWQALAQWPSLFLVCKEASNSDAPVFGYALAAPAEQPQQVWIMSLLVAQAGRGKGIGRKLMDELLAALSRHGYHEALLTVAPNNLAAVKLYQSLGFEVTALKKDYLGPAQDRYLMRKLMLT